MFPGRPEFDTCNKKKLCSGEFARYFGNHCCWLVVYIVCGEVAILLHQQGPGNQARGLHRQQEIKVLRRINSKQFQVGSTNSFSSTHPFCRLVFFLNHPSPSLELNGSRNFASLSSLLNVVKFNILFIQNPHQFKNTA